MASKKSCTHFTWAEAKAKTGGASKTTAKNNTKGQAHNDILASKIIAKNGGNTTANKKIAKAYARQEKRTAEKAAQLEKEKEERRLESLKEVKLYDRAKEKLSELFSEWQEKPLLPSSSLADDNNNDKSMTKICECKEMQQEEIIALEAMIPEDFSIVTESYVTELREKIEEWQASPDDETLQKAICDHPPLSYLIKLEIDNNNPEFSTSTDGEELNGLFLIRVTLPDLYPNERHPIFEFLYTMVTDKTIFCSAEKPLDSIAWLEEDKVQEAIKEQASDLLPYPCVYELAVTWFSENCFNYMQCRPQY